MRVASPSPSISRLPRVLVIGVAAGIFAVGFLIAAVGAIPLYQSLTGSRDAMVLQDLRAVSNTLRQYLLHLDEVAAQITSRTKAREKLEAYNRGAIDLATLRAFSIPILEDALSLKPALLGITRLDAQAQAVIETGLALPPALLPDDLRALESARMRGPLTIDGNTVILVYAAIRNRAGATVGADVVAFDYSELPVLLHDLARDDEGQDVVLSREAGGTTEILFRSHASEQAGAAERYLDSIGAIRREAMSEEPRLAPRRDTAQLGDVAGYTYLPRAAWLLTSHDTPTTSLGVVHRELVIYVLVLFGIAILGSAATYFLLRPYADRFEAMTRDLQVEIAERENTRAALAARIRQQAAVAELGLLALSGVDIPLLLQRAVELAATTLGVDFAKVLEIETVGSSAIMRAGLGWNVAPGSDTRVPLDEGSQAGYTLHSKEPLVVDDLRSEARFSGPALLREHGVISGISVIIGAASPWGILGVHARRRIAFSSDDINFVQALANCIAEAIERQRAEQALISSEERFRALYDDNPSMFTTVDGNCHIESVNEYGASQLGYSRVALLGRNALEIIHAEDRALAAENILSCFQQPSLVHRWELRKLKSDGTALWVMETGRVVSDDHDRPQLLIVSEDVSEARSLSRELNYQATHDPLTGLFNRREFEARLNEALNRARQSDASHVLVYLDLDQFKVINDTCGHVAGDQLLCQLTTILKAGMRKRDVIARLGGDEFGLLIEDCGIEQAETIARALRDRVEAFRFNWHERSFIVNLSMGLVPIGADASNITDLLKHADAACYAAKDAGRNRIHIYQANDIELARRQGEMQWVARINDALESNRFCLYAQQIAPLHAGVDQRPHHELLVRMIDEDERIISPAAFLPAAERYNLAVRIDRWVVGSLFAYIERYPEFLREMGICSINLSGQSLADDEFLDFMVDLLVRERFDAHQLCFEITETAAISNLANALRFIERIKTFGCTFALDDFGSGVASFAYLKTLPVDYLKIDGVFVKDIARDQADRAMVKSIHDVGKALGKLTIAEFVEDDAIRRILQEIGVDFAQGYGIGRPRSIDEFDAVRHARVAVSASAS